MFQSGREFFEIHSVPGSKKCKAMLDIDPDVLLRWEKEPVNQLSPGVVEDGEELLQQIVDPVHFTEEGGITAKAFDAITSHGLSVHRLSHSSLDVINQIAIERAQKYNRDNPTKPQRRFCGFIEFNSAELRKIFCEVQNRRVFHIFDSATKEDISHAEVCQTARDVPAENGRPSKKHRFALYELVRNRKLAVA